MGLVKDRSLAEKGRLRIEWARAHMPVLSLIRKRFEEKRPLKGVVVGACLHVTKETAVLVETLATGGAEVYLAPSNPLSTQDDVAAALDSEEGIEVYAWRGMSREEYYSALGFVLAAKPRVVLDDGADLISVIHKVFYGIRDDAVRVVEESGASPSVARGVRGGTEETTTGVVRLKSLEKEGKLLFPIIAVNNSRTKFLFDNRYGTGQSALDGIMRATNILLAGKKVVVVGYGWVGRGIALRARGMGARVMVVEADPVRALEAVYDGFEVGSMREAASQGDVFITATGNLSVIRSEHFMRMKDGVVLANAGHFNVEIDVSALEEIAVAKRRVRDNVDEYVLPGGRRIILLAEGRLVNLVAAEGHPSEVMDLSFSNQALAVEHILRSRRLRPRVYRLPDTIDRRIALLKLRSLGIRIEKLTREQKDYMRSWALGT